MRALLKEILKNPLAMVYAILVHVVLAGVLFVSMEWVDLPTPAQPEVNIVKAVVVDESRVLAEVEKLKKTEAKKEKEEKAKQNKLDKQAREAEAKRQREEKRLATLRKEREAEKKQQKQRQEKRKAEEKREQKRQKERKAEEKRVAAEQAKKKKEVERLKAEQAALEKKRIAEEKRLADAAAKRKMLDEKRRRDAEATARRAEFAAEQQSLEAENEKRLSSLGDIYEDDIKNKIERSWIRPASARVGLSCKVSVNQIPGGEVINVTVTQCTGDDVFRRSVEAAVYKASPLPRPPDPALFARDILFDFKPKK